jgi:hypothetical protein
MKYLFGIATTLALAGFCLPAAEPSSDPVTSSTWYAGTGPRTQVWILNVRGNSITGAVCGPCDDPRNLAPIVDGKIIDANHITFFILHDLQGGLFAQYGPYRNEARVTISGDTADFTSHLENEPWSSHPVHQNWKLLSRKAAAGGK